MKKLVSSDVNQIIDFIRESAKTYHFRERALNNTLELLKCIIPAVVDRNNSPIEVQVYRRSITKGSIRLIVEHEEIDFASEFSKALKNIDIERDIEGPDAQKYINELILDSHNKEIQYKHKNGKNIVTISLFNITNKALCSTILAFFVAILLGVFFKTFFEKNTVDAITTYVFNPFVTMFLNALSMAAFPLIFTTIALCIANIGTVGTFGKIGKSSAKVYILTFIVLDLICMIFCLVFRFGDPALADAVGVLPTKGYENIDTSTRFVDVIADIVPSNIFSPFLEGKILSVLFLGILFGLVLAMLKDKVPTFIKLIEEINKVFLKIVDVIIWFVPFAIVCNVSKLIIGIPIESLYSVLEWIVAILIMTAIVFAVYFVAIAIFVRVNPFVFFKKTISTWLTANGVGSSTVVMPKGMEACKDCGVDSKIYSITMPLGTSLNKNGSIISNTVTAFFMCNIFEVKVDATLIVSLILLVFVFCVAAPSVNGGGIICMSAIFAQLGIPASAIGLYIVINPVVDLTVTGTNVLGNVFASFMVAAKQKMLDKNVYAIKSIEK